MYLKEIKLNGFKSFADKTNIDFKSGITGIVGPNGSGKSNIVDAIRWVLGEQSIKSLRGDGSMTDVIFSGSKSRNPASRASVTLVFDNQNHYFSVDYSEVSVKRVVYQTGENEYFLNESKCRLKDITDLILDTGIGKEAFNIISQGNIQEILSCKPEDRRIIFEEAAEVLKYKKRKEEALHKLDKTHNNINRVDDIINELEQQIKPLKEQSEKAKIYLDTKKELEQVEIALIVNDVEKLNDEYQYYKDKIDCLKEEIIELSKNSSVNQAELEKVKVDYTNKNEELYKLQQKLIELTAEVEQLKGQKNLIIERKKYNDKEDKMHEELLIKKEQQLNLQNNIEKEEKDIELKQVEMNDLDNILNKLESKTNDLKKANTDLEMDLNNKYHYELKTKNDITFLEDSIENNSRLPYGLKMVLNNPKIKGIHNIIGKLIKVDDKYVKAINVALGSSSNFIVVDNENVAKDAINYLKENKIGRATFFPLNIIKGRIVASDVYNKIKDDSFFVDIAANLVNYDSKYKNIIDNQLGNVLVVKDIDGANRIGKNINHSYNIVTLDGESFHVGGSVTGGSLKNFKGVINEEYELEKKRKLLSKLNEEIKILKDKKNNIDNDLEEKKMKHYDVKVKKASLEEIIVNKIREIKEEKEKLIGLDKDISNMNNLIKNGFNDEEERIMNNYYIILKEKNQIEQQIEFLSKKIYSSKENIEEIEQSIKYFNSSYYKKQETLKELEIELNRKDVKLDSLLNILNEEYSITFEKAKKEYILYFEKNEARLKVEQLKKIIKDLGIVNIASIDEYERVSKRYEFLIEQKNDLLKAKNTLLEIIKEMDLIMKETFEETFELIKEEFKKVFKELFGGGKVELKLTNPNDMLETGIEIVVLPPGKNLQHISLLSGGEKSLTAIALLFSILRVRPVPFCFLDEVESALDEVNVEAFAKFINKLKDKSQFIIITHQKKTMEYVDNLYGVTMQESGVSKLVSVKLEDIN